MFVQKFSTKFVTFSDILKGNTFENNGFKNCHMNSRKKKATTSIMSNWNYGKID
jgi:hypothetical protein